MITYPKLWCGLMKRSQLKLPDCGTQISQLSLSLVVVACSSTLLVYNYKCNHRIKLLAVVYAYVYTSNLSF